MSLRSSDLDSEECEDVYPLSQEITYLGKGSPTKLKLISHKVDHLRTHRLR